jgi:hypothetical protein
MVTQIQRRGKKRSQFQNVLTYTLKMEAIFSSETLVYNYKPTRCHNPEDLNLNNLRYENPKAYIYAY